MTKKFIIPILSTVGGILFAIGMRVTMVWEGFMIPGIAVGRVGIILPLCLIPVCRGSKIEVTG